MIVDPDFPDHWKTRMLVDSLDGDEAAPVYLLRLWAHCQNRRTCVFENLPQAALKALCRFPGHANKFESSLAASGFVRREDQSLIVIGWEEYNASLIANWTNGKLGGRPKKEPKPNPPPTNRKPMGNPSASHGEPIREDEIGKEHPPTPQGGDWREESNPPRKARSSMTMQQKHQTKHPEITPRMIQIGSWFGRLPDTKWSIAEAEALERLNPPQNEIDGMEFYYTASIPTEDNHRRTALYTLLNNWSIDLDRARKLYRERHQP
jgi:hypothetical protein